MTLFKDRVDAGKRLASALTGAVDKKAIVLAIPRGGVVVAFEVAQKLKLPLDVILPRKIGAPGNPELAIGAITEDGSTFLDKNLMKYLQVSQAYVQNESKKQKAEIERRLKVYRGDSQPPNLKGRDVIIVDDGIATGSTMKAALSSVLKSGAKKVVVAIPVGPPSTLDELKKQAYKVVCLQTPESFYALGEFYDSFVQTDDEEVIRLLDLSRESHPKQEGNGYAKS